MCARFRSLAEMEAFIALYGKVDPRNWEYNPNVAPTDTAPIIRSSHSKGHKLELARFGLVPAWAKDVKIGVRYLNARSEGIETNKVYSKAFEERRCVIPVEGFYEWQEEDGKKIPYMVHRKDGQPMSLAGVWDFTKLNGESIYSFSIITGPPSALTEPLHDRTPIILDDALGWLSEGGNAYFQHPDDRELKISRKNPLMNKPTVKDLSQIDLNDEAS